MEKPASSRLLRVLWLPVLLILAAALPARASHLFGADLYYTWVSGNTYRITLAAYGDCSGGSFPSLATSTPNVEVYLNGSSSVSSTLILSLQGTGVEVSPVCASDLNNTTCKNGTVPGVTRYIYSATYNTGATPGNFRFRFNGTMGSAASAGRSNSITNIASGSTLVLEATLNTAVATGNSSPTYTTIPTPFFCINNAQGYNPGAVDPNGDSLSFALVTGLNTPGTVSYLAGYSAIAPLAVTTGTLSTSATTGQIDFTPNLAQKSLVVSKVTEYKNGVVAGTSMREMTFVVLNTCNNAPPGGTLSNGSANISITTGTTAQACSSGGTVSFSINPLDPNGDTIDVTSAGIPAGATFTVANNGTPAPAGSFSWNVTAVPAGTYTFFVTFADRGCPLSSKQTTAYTITVLPSPSYTFTLVSAATCTKKAVFTLTPNSTSSRTLTVKQGTTTVISKTGVTGDYTDSLVAGTYSVTSGDASGCTATLTFTLAAPAVPVSTAVVTPPVCHGGSNGAIAVTASGGVTPYSYALDAGAYGTSGSFTGLTSGTYTVHIKGANDCVKDTTIVVPVTPDIKPVLNFTEPPCNAFNTGAISVVASQGTAPYQYALGSGAFGASNTFTGLSSGFYTIHIRDANACTKDTTVLLPDSVQVKANISVTNILCNGASTGAVTLVAFGTSAPYTYALGSGAYGSSGTFTGLPAGATTFHVQDPRGCHLDTVLTLTQPTALAAVLTPAEPLCFAGNDGSIAVAASGGVPSYTYSLNGGSYTGTLPFSALTAGAYTVTVKDANNCTANFSTTITQPTAVAVSVAAVRPSCFGLADGSLTLSASGGTAPYTYALGTGAYGTSGVFGGLAAGTYTLHAKDDHGCVKDTTVVLTQPAQVGIGTLVRNNRCVPLTTGQIIVVPSGGTPAFTYSINSGAYGTSPTFGNLGPGTYVLSIKDANNCLKDTTVSLIDSTAIHATIVITNAKCFDSSSGSLVVTGKDGVAPYRYSLNGAPAQTSSTFSNLFAGSKAIRILDSFGCQLDTGVLLTQPDRLVPSVQRVQPLCFGDANGSITVTLTGGTPAFTYAMGGGSYGSSPTFTGLPAGPYTFRFIDANNCYGDTTVTLNQPAALRIDSVNVRDALCFGGASGIITVYGRGGTKPYTYSYDASATQLDSNLKNLPAGTHTVHLIDANGCQVDLPVGVGQPTQLYFADAAVIMPTCEGFADGVVNVRGKGGTPPYQYSPDNGVTFDTYGGYPNLVEGTYSFTVRDAQGCRHDTTIVLTGYPHILPDIAVTPVRCWGEASGSVVFAVTGGVPPLTYQKRAPLPMGGITSDPEFDSLTAATYTFRITDAKGCKKDTTVAVIQPDSLTINPSLVPNDCIGLDNTGAINTAVKGGNPPYVYTWGWNGANSATGISVSNLPNGIYPIIVTDTKGCADTVRIKIGYDNCCTPFVPNAFTPNGDGKNDTWRVLYKGDMTLQNLSVYNRYGQRVYVSANATDEWNGTFEGKPADAGTYFYYLKIVCGDKGNNILEFSGDLTLIR